MLQVKDRRGGSQTTAQLSVLAAATVGIYASAASAELFNTAPFNGQAVTTTISAYT